MTDTKHPLVHRELNAEERTRLNPDLTPINATPEERLAAQPITHTEKPMPEVPVAAPSFTIPPALKKVALAIATLGGLALLALPLVPAIPAIVTTYVFIVTAVAGLLAGVGMKSFMPSKPIIPLTLVPGALTIAGLITAQAMTMPEGFAKNALLVGAGILGVLAGKGIQTSEEVKPAPTAPPQV
jgi:hypothetical protein